MQELLKVLLRASVAHCIIDTVVVGRLHASECDMRRHLNLQQGIRGLMVGLSVCRDGAARHA